MRETYADWTAKARAFLGETGPRHAAGRRDVRGRPVAGVPAAGPRASRSYMAPPAFSDRWKGHFFVPFAPDGASEEEIQARLSNNSYGVIPTTSVHEAYPGPPLAPRDAQGATRRDVRRVYSTPYFTEGWALYAERVMRERGFFEDPIHELHHLEATLFRAARIVVDTSLHLGEMTFDEAVAFMMDKAAHARADRARRGRPLLLVADPGVVVPHRLPRDPAIRRPLPGRTRVRRRVAPRDVPIERAARVPRRARVVRRAAAGPRRARGAGDAGLAVG